MQLALFIDNLSIRHTVNNYALGQTDGTLTPQQNTYTFRPRTFGVTCDLAHSTEACSRGAPLGW